MKKSHGWDFFNRLLVGLRPSPLLWSCENFGELANYKHFVPPGLLVTVRNFVRKNKNLRTTFAECDRGFSYLFNTGNTIRDAYTAE